MKWQLPGNQLSIFDVYPNNKLINDIVSCMIKINLRKQSLKTFYCGLRLQAFQQRVIEIQFNFFHLATQSNLGSGKPARLAAADRGLHMGERQEPTLAVGSRMIGC